MKNKQIQTLKGFRDFLPKEKRQRDYITKIIKQTFENFAFEPLETPTLEYAELLLGKYGDEADKLVYTFEDRGKRKVGLRYDQTVPTARVLNQYQNELPKFFRRYQIQNVFRADKPQKGRYREFTQCDADIFSTNSPLADAEILAACYFIFKNIGFKNIILQINDRQTLFNALKPFENSKISVLKIIQSLDKLDKLESNQVIEELVTKGLSKQNAEKALAAAENASMSENLSKIIEAIINLGVPKTALKFTPTLARGLDYYTGMIFEITMPGTSYGSFGGGGRYNNLIENLGGPSTPAVGVGLGFDRIVNAAIDQNLIPDNDSGTKVLMALFGKETQVKSFEIARRLRENNIKTEIYPQIDKLSKQFKLANQKNIPYVIVIGDDELEKNLVSLKNMSSGEQKQISVEELTKLF
jgi:histidyl-tRNA synthetase